MMFEVTEAGPGTSLVVMRGRLDVVGCETVEVPFTAAVGNAEGNAMLDASGLEFVGSLGLRLLISTARVLQRRQRQIVVYGAPPAVREVFDTVSLEQMIPIFATEAEARAFLGL
ncbi:MAG: STAS domain-containing protein [Rubritepida sp.]|jgi:anti-anti-sigma factor|nr:STAS domain-containing protein [Rubritepida sp.]